MQRFGIRGQIVALNYALNFLVGKIVDLLVQFVNLLCHFI